MSVKIAQPTAEDAKKYPREYAIFTQIPGALHGSVKSEVGISVTRSWRCQSSMP